MSDEPSVQSRHLRAEKLGRRPQRTQSTSVRNICSSVQWTNAEAEQTQQGSKYKVQLENKQSQSSGCSDQSHIKEHLPLHSLCFPGQTLNQKSAMMHAALGIWILSAVICVGRGDHHHGDQDTALDNSANSVSLVAAANKEFAYRLQTRHLEKTPVKAAAVFVDDNFKPRPEFLETLKQSYFADGFTVDFANAADSANTINEYVKGKTNGKIEELVKDPDPMTVMYLISYIYYKGKWATPFEPELTKEDTFTVDENTKVQVQMMNKEKRFDIYYDQAINTSVLHLPFNSSYSMLLMLPD
ncbi:Alpha-1-antitrypsin-like protein [Larimichthys crocea]|uniref:Uncharacterized protein n=1 Tax=Larimichthys crocea TaxID=215358 RepID=A0ACD3Q9K4_LARCR|nr:Alpha-1-antitrypsin-like protein [Larimichthys crocea]